MTVSHDILRSFITARDIERVRMFAGIKTQIGNLFAHITEALENVKKRYNCVVPDLNALLHG